MSPSQQNHRTWNPSHGIRFQPPNPTYLTDASAWSVGGLVAPRVDQRVECGEYVDARSTESATGDTAHPASEAEPSCKAKAEARIEESLPEKMFATPRGYHIPRTRYIEATQSGQNDTTAYWQYTMFQGPGGPTEKVKLHYCKSKAAMETVAKLFLQEKVIGFDIEWMAQARTTDGTRKNVSLIQIASDERIALFHIARFPEKDEDDLIAPTFRQIMESSDVTKVGVAIKADCTRLRNFFTIDSRGIFELSYLHKLIMYCSRDIGSIDRRLVRLAEQVQEHFGLPILKGDVQVSDWSKDLDYRQIQYAASDSYANLLLYHVMEAKRLALEPAPPRPAHAELNIAISLGEQARKQEVAELVDEDDEESSSSIYLSDSDASVEELARDYFHVSLADTPNRDQSIKRPGRSSKTTSGANLQSRSPGSLGSDDQADSLADSQSPRSVIQIYRIQLERANIFVNTYKNTGNRYIAPQSLRAYSLWHEQELEISTVASILRSPPIQNRTVVSYICDAMCCLPADVQCPPAKILNTVTEYGYQPFIKAHRDLIAKVTKEAKRA